MRAVLPFAALGQLMPMHLLLDAEARILSAGPTLQKVCGEAPLAGDGFFDRFEVRRPAGLCDVPALAARPGARLAVVQRGGRGQPFRGFAVPLGDGRLMLKLSFGIAVDEAVAAHGLKAADFAPTDVAVELLYLLEAKAHITAELRDLAQRLQGAHRAAEAQAMTDTLTGLANRRALDAAMGAVAGEDLPFGLMHVDLDWFKAVNDTHGHAAGDHVLRAVAAMLREEVRKGDTVARVGGDEFVLLFPGLVDRALLARIAGRVVARLSEPIDFEGRTCRISASIGIAVSTDYDRPTARAMMADADAALYASKKAGRGRAQFHAAGPAAN
jgi:diguanylate cyclase (GGDEF)-like protein